MRSTQRHSSLNLNTLSNQIIISTYRNSATAAQCDPTLHLNTLRCETVQLVGNVGNELQLALLRRDV